MVPLSDTCRNKYDKYIIFYLLMNQISLKQYERGHRFPKKFINGSKNNRHSNFIETNSYTTITWAIATSKQLINLFNVPRYLIPSNEAFCRKWITAKFYGDIPIFNLEDVI